MGVSIARFLDCEIPATTWFSRKTYFYPDLPKNFQITQYDTPIGERGTFEFQGKTVRITRVHLEEDPGRIKRVGKSGEEVSLIDYNRSGIPLVEIVTEPDLRSPAEARDFVTDLLIELRHLVNLSEGGDQTVRVDSNISIGKERVEIKNILGLKNMERGLKFEAIRQTRLLKAGKKVVRETRRFDEERKVTVSARKKELEEDYGYIGEPDLGVFNLETMVRGTELPETPLRRAERISRECSVPGTMARQIVLTSHTLADLMEHLCSSLPPESVVPWISGILSSHATMLEERYDDALADEIASIIGKVIDGRITDLEGRRKMETLLSGGEEIKEGGEGGPQPELEGIVMDLVESTPSIVDDYRENEKAANHLIGQVMRATGGRFSSGDVVDAVKRELRRRL